MERNRLAAAAAFAGALLVLAGCSRIGIDGASTARDAEGRPLAAPPAAASPCPTVPGAPAPAPDCLVHHLPSQLYVEQSIPDLLPTRGYGSISRVRCTGRIPAASFHDNSHWTCVGQEPEGTYLHEDVIWNPDGGLLALAAVSRDRSSGLVTPEPEDPGLPNPDGSPSASG